MISTVDTYVQAVTLRNDVLGAGIVDFVRAAARSITTVCRAVQGAWHRRSTIRELEALDDRMLRDIGLERHEIADFVTRNQTKRAASASPSSAIRRFGQALGPSWRSLRASHRARVTRRELRRLDRRQLSDIGLQAGDVDSVARDLATRSLAPARAANDNRQTIAA